MNIRILIGATSYTEPVPTFFGYGGWSCLLFFEKDGKWKYAVSHSGGLDWTIPGALTLTAVVCGLKSIKNGGHHVEILLSEKQLELLNACRNLLSSSRKDLTEEYSLQAERQASVVFRSIESIYPDGNVPAAVQKAEQLAEMEKKTVREKGKEREVQIRKEITKEKIRNKENPSSPEGTLPPVIHVGCQISGEACHTAIVIGGIRFLSEKGFDEVREASAQKREVVETLRHQGIQTDEIY